MFYYCRRRIFTTAVGRCALEHELYDAVERWWTNRNHAFRSRVREPLPAIEQRLHACLRAVVGEVFRLDGADGLNLGLDNWRAVVGSLRMSGPILSGGRADNWLDQVNACTADGLHHVTVRTAGRLPDAMRESDDFSDSDSDSDSEHDDEHDPAPDLRVLRVIYGGPQRFETYEELGGAPPANLHGRVDQVLVVP